MYQIIEVEAENAISQSGMTSLCIWHNDQTEMLGKGGVGCLKVNVSVNEERFYKPYSVK